MLLDQGADIESTDVDGATPLHVASYHGAENVIRMLRQRGCNMDAKLKASLSSMFLIYISSNVLSCVFLEYYSGVCS